MAFNAILEGALQQLLVKRLGMQVGSPAPTLAPEVMPALVLENDRPEWGFLKREQRFSAACNVSAGGAATFATARIRNPTGSNAIIVVRSILVSAAAAITVRSGAVMFETTDLTSAESPGRRDARQPFDALSGVGRAVASVSHGTPASAAGGQLFDHPIAAQTGLWLNEACILTPGSSLDVGALAANVQISVGFHWTERGAVPGELLE